MNINEFLYKEFNNKTEKYYCDEIIESKIINLEAKILQKLDSDEIDDYKEVKKCLKQLEKNKQLRIIDFVINKFT